MRKTKMSIAILLFIQLFLFGSTTGTAENENKTVNLLLSEFRRTIDSQRRFISRDVEERKKHTENTDAELKRTREEIKSYGDRSVDAIMNEYKEEPSGPYRSALERLMEEIDPKLFQSARKVHYRQLLKSKDRNDVSTALFSLRRIELDDALYQDILGVINNAHTRDRDASNIQQYFGLEQSAITVLVSDTSGKYTTETISTIFNSIAKVEKSPASKIKLHEGSIGSYGDYQYMTLVQLLEQIPKYETVLPTHYAALPEGMEKTCAALALSRKGPLNDYRTTFRSFINNPKYNELSRMRLMSVSILGEYGTEEDIPFLESLSITDTYKVERYFHYTPGERREKWDGQLINLTRKQMALSAEELAVPPEGAIPEFTRITFPVRDAAKWAIVEIEKR